MSSLEIVNGTIIGEITYPYEFWIGEPCVWLQTKRGIPERKIAKGFFADDSQAIAWFKENYPEEILHNIEMRCFDQD